MSDMDWTPEPWHVVLSDNATPFVQHECGYDYTDIQDKSSLVCKMPVEIVDSFNSLSNAKRIVSCVNACTGAPASIQPGAVVALAESLERCLEVLEFREAMSPECKEARAALALYNGTETRPMTTDNTAVIRQLEREVDLLREENKGLRCQVERLRSACQLGIDMMAANDCDLPKTFETMQDAIAETPAQSLAQSLAAIRAEAAEMTADQAMEYAESKAKFGGDQAFHVYNYIKQLRTGGES